MCVCVCVHTCLCAIVPIHSVSHSFLILHQWEAAVILFLCSSPLCVHALHNSVYTYIYISVHTRLQRALSFLPTVVCCLFGVSSSVVLPVWSPTSRLNSSQHWSHFVCLTASNPAHTRSLSHTDTHRYSHKFEKWNVNWKDIVSFVSVLAAWCKYHGGYRGCTCECVYTFDAPDWRLHAEKPFCH